MSTLEPGPGDRQPWPEATKIPPAAVLTVAVVCAAVAGHYTDWDTAATVFTAVVSLFTRRPPRE